ncbi:MAG: tRNA (adenosine(37)-N6)-threonylcarbamoyltransferase complex ATPase subunit type 1 TsaE [Candidatus Yanofskybacteria bacterium RIFCSPHIGHO2_01_FULL_44_17]|uniref:tRNA threonylcarbamoyladenosine biosynthesis protein TsaE n=1 Tax=Candidatus Yanofskybacteria bacterium RIFCSPHIGHO2_01_FULL_44_17 TaxID=1802668 RepID=A0A1F8EUC4_9BACT|nr:MAG: tRNA (adenosine(37)-N6)-threonylcarbamoyltransferase complex ATPase subunit type 1 TsaE [Candidatus Yanofskybacteria bacterium RIFCSPHIGHO2_01_FULL_44_17]
MKIISRNIKDTNETARNLAKKIIKIEQQGHATIMAFEGELGAGKTTFIKAFARALGIKTHITSPTFVLLKAYKLKLTNYRHLIHVDAYRLKNYRDLLPLGIGGLMADPKNIIVLEWSERIKQILPRKHIKIHIDHVNETTRRINIS